MEIKKHTSKASVFAYLIVLSTETKILMKITQQIYILQFTWSTVQSWPLKYGRS